MTPYELRLSLEAYAEETKDRQQELIMQSYLTANWVRCKRMPNINKILGIEEKPKEMTIEDMLDEVKKLNKSMGGNEY